MIRPFSTPSISSTWARDSEIVERTKLILQRLERYDELPVTLSGFAIEQAGEELGRVAQLLGVLADLMPRLVVAPRRSRPFFFTLRWNDQSAIRQNRAPEDRRRQGWEMPPSVLSCPCRNIDHQLPRARDESASPTRA